MDRSATTSRFAKNNPIYENKCPELTVREMLFWSRTLNVTPSQLFSLSDEELEKRINISLQGGVCPPATSSPMGMASRPTKVSYIDHWKSLQEMKRQLVAERQENRLEGGGMPIYPGLWAILTEAAYEIEEYVKEQKGPSAPFQSACSPPRAPNNSGCSPPRAPAGSGGYGCSPSFAGGSYGSSNASSCPPSPSSYAMSNVSCPLASSTQINSSGCSMDDDDEDEEGEPYSYIDYSIETNDTGVEETMTDISVDKYTGAVESVLVSQFKPFDDRSYECNQTI